MSIIRLKRIFSQFCDFFNVINVVNLVNLVILCSQVSIFDREYLNDPSPELEILLDVAIFSILSKKLIILSYQRGIIL